MNGLLANWFSLSSTTSTALWFLLATNTRCPFFAALITIDATTWDFPVPGGPVTTVKLFLKADKTVSLCCSFNSIASDKLNSGLEIIFWGETISGKNVLRDVDEICYCDKLFSSFSSFSRPWVNVEASADRITPIL